MSAWHWQQWYIVVITIANLVVAVSSPTTGRRIYGLLWVAMFLFTLITAGFFPWT